MPQVVVTIDGKTYRMACAEGEEEHLEALAQRFDRNLAQLRDAFGSIGDQRLTVMTGISVLDQLADAERKLEANARDLEELARLRAEAVDKVDRTEGELTERVEAITKRLIALTDALRRPHRQGS